MFCSFIGTNYFGFQRQKLKTKGDLNTVQYDLEKVMSQVLNQEIKLHTCSRTDTGVHAKNLAFKIVFNNPKSIKIEEIKKRLNYQFINKKLDISISDIYYHHQDLDIQKDVIQKEYAYSIDANLQLNTFNVFQRNKQVWSIQESLNIDLFDQALQLYKGQHNFLNFTMQYDHFKNIDQYIREVKSVEIVQSKHEMFNQAQSLKVHITGKNFMKYQIRFMVGLAYRYQQNKCDLDYVKQMLNPKQIEFTQFILNRSRLKAPPEGLCLENVLYPQQLLYRDLNEKINI